MHISFVRLRRRIRIFCTYNFYSVIFLLAVIIFCIFAFSSYQKWQGQLEMEQTRLLIAEEVSWANRTFHHQNIANTAQIMQPPNWSQLVSSFDVCLATHTTIDRLSPIGQVAQYWRGPISLAIYLQERHEVKVLQKFLTTMKTCHALFSETVTVTIVISKELALASLSLDDIGLPILSDHDEETPINCKVIASPMHTKIWLKELVRLYLTSTENSTTIRRKMNSKNIPVYPQNHLRNIARMNCETDWTFVTDVDLVPKNNSASLLQEFYQSEETKTCFKCAFVIPTFALMKGHCNSQPKTKRELLDLVVQKKAEPFHFTSFESAQYPTDYTKWSATFKDEEPVHVSHKVNYSIIPNFNEHGSKDFSFYEPFYISSNDIPIYDTMFIGYGFTRNSQTFEAIVSGWTFYVLTPIWTTHCGIRQPQNWKMVAQNPRLLQTRNNEKLYLQFMSKTWKKYKNQKT